MVEEEEAMRRLQSVGTGAASGGVPECACVCFCVYVPVLVCARVCACVRAGEGEHWLSALCCICVRVRVCARACALLFRRACVADCFIPRCPHHVCVCVYVSVSCLSVCLWSVCMCGCACVAETGQGQGGGLGGGGEVIRQRGERTDYHRPLLRKRMCLCM